MSRRSSSNPQNKEAKDNYDYVKEKIEELKNKEATTAAALAFTIASAEEQTRPAESAESADQQQRISNKQQQQAATAATAAAATTAAAAAASHSNSKRTDSSKNKINNHKTNPARGQDQRGEKEGSIPSEERAATIETTTGRPTFTFPVSGREKQNQEQSR